MRKAAVIVILVGLMIFMSCSSSKKAEETAGKTEVAAKVIPLENPFFSEFNTPFNVPTFDKIKVEHILPGLKEGIKQQQAEIETIINNKETATFANTIEALEKSGTMLKRVYNFYDVLKNSMVDEALQKAAKEIAPLYSAQKDYITLNEKLFARIKAVDAEKDKLNLTVEQRRLLDKYFKEFVMGGANLAPDKKPRFQAINEELSVLYLKFSDNVLAENNSFQLVLDKKEDLAGLPQSVLDGAADVAKERNQPGKWVFTLHKPSLIPFLQYAEKRELREQMFKAYINRGNNNNQYDTKALILKIQTLRAELSKLLGFANYAAYRLDENMAKTPAAVFKLLDEVWKPALALAKKEAKELGQLIKKEGKTFKLEPWDWWFYAEKLKKAKFDLDDQVMRPYFKLENVRDGAFAVASKLWGLKFIERTNVPTYHPEAKVFEVQEADGRHVGILYVDYFPRASKVGGAWMNSFREQSNRGGKQIRPLITNNGNFPRPAGDTPSLLSFDDVTTLFHEFGHALHGLLANATYEKISGTNVARDFVELPSQIMENWASEPEVLKMYAKHYQTGEVIPLVLVEKIKKANQFNQGFISLEFLAACYLDMDWQMLTSTDGVDVNAFETKSMNKIGMIPEIVVRYRSTNFSHIFSGEYAAGYYSYIWAEVLDADAFGAFKEKGIFDPATALSFRKNILEKGATDDPMAMYKTFRGREPKVEYLLKRRGLK